MSEQKSDIPDCPVMRYLKADLTVNRYLLIDIIFSPIMMVMATG